MPRLTTFKPKMQEHRPRLAPARGERGRDAERRKAKPWRKWYMTKRWREMRKARFAEVGGICEQTGVLLVGRHPAPDSPVLDHIRPHRGDERLFFDPGNVQLVSKAWHDSEKQKQERRGDR